MARMLGSFIHDDSGQNLVEYGLVVGLVGLAAITAMTGLGTRVGNAFSTMGSALTSAV